MKRGHHQLTAIDEDDDAADEGGDVIRHLKPVPADEGDADADQGGAGGDGVRTMVPRIAFESGAGGLVTLAHGIT